MNPFAPGTKRNPIKLTRSDAELADLIEMQAPLVCSGRLPDSIDEDARQPQLPSLLCTIVTITLGIVIIVAVGVLTAWLLKL